MYELPELGKRGCFHEVNALPKKLRSNCLTSNIEMTFHCKKKAFSDLTQCIGFGPSSQTINHLSDKCLRINLKNTTNKKIKLSAAFLSADMSNYSQNFEMKKESDLLWSQTNEFVVFPNTPLSILLRKSNSAPNGNYANFIIKDHARDGLIVYQRLIKPGNHRFASENPEAPPYKPTLTSYSLSIPVEFESECLNDKESLFSKDLGIDQIKKIGISFFKKNGNRNSFIQVQGLLENKTCLLNKHTLIMRINNPTNFGREFICRFYINKKISDVCYVGFDHMDKDNFEPEKKFYVSAYSIAEILLKVNKKSDVNFKVLCDDELFFKTKISACTYSKFNKKSTKVWNSYSPLKFRMASPLPEEIKVEKLIEQKVDSNLDPEFIFPFTIFEPPFDEDHFPDIFFIEDI